MEKVGDCPVSIGVVSGNTFSKFIWKIKNYNKARKKKKKSIGKINFVVVPIFFACDKKFYFLFFLSNLKMFQIFAFRDLEICYLSSSHTSILWYLLSCCDDWFAISILCFNSVYFLLLVLISKLPIDFLVCLCSTYYTYNIQNHICQFQYYYHFYHFLPWIQTTF